MMNIQHSDELYSQEDNSIAISLRKAGLNQFTWTLANLSTKRRAIIVISPPTSFEERKEISLPPGEKIEMHYDNVKQSYRWKIAKMVGSGGLSYEILCDIKMSDIEQNKSPSIATKQIRTHARRTGSDTQTTATTPPKRLVQEVIRQGQKPSEPSSKTTLPSDVSSPRTTQESLDTPRRRQDTPRIPPEHEEFDPSGPERTRGYLQVILEDAQNVQTELSTINKRSNQLYSELRTTVQNINELYKHQQEVCEQTEQFHSQVQETYHEIVQIRKAAVVRGGAG